MLAAATSRSDRALETVKLVLALEAQKQQYPEKLRNYFNEVLRQTVDLLRDPSDAAATALPEAVSLALRLSANSALRTAIEEMLQNGEIRSSQAEVALSNLEAGVEPNFESAHFSKEIYAAI